LEGTGAEEVSSPSRGKKEVCVIDLIRADSETYLKGLQSEAKTGSPNMLLSGEFSHGSVFYSNSRYYQDRSEENPAFCLPSDPHPVVFVRVLPEVNL
jgi:hypothetical protein